MHGLDLLVLVARGNFLRALHGFLSLDRHFFKSQHIGLTSCCRYRKGAATLASPLS